MPPLLLLVLAANAAPDVSAEVGPMPRMIGEFAELKTETGTLHGIISEVAQMRSIAIESLLELL